MWRYLVSIAAGLLLAPPFASVYWAFAGNPTPSPTDLIEGHTYLVTIDPNTIHDADTIWVTRSDGTSCKVRLAWIDAPELLQPHGDDALHFVQGFLAAAPRYRLYVVSSREYYGRVLGTLRANYEGSPNLNTSLVRQGWAWSWPAAKRPDLNKLESQAKAAKLGLWSSPRAQAPWEYRKQQKQAQQTEGK